MSGRTPASVIMASLQRTYSIDHEKRERLRTDNCLEEFLHLDERCKDNLAAQEWMMSIREAMQP